MNTVSTDPEDAAARKAAERQAYMRTYREINRERLRAKAAIYNRAPHRAAYRETYREQIRARDKAWRDAHPDRRRKVYKAWAAVNLGYINASAAARRAGLKRATPAWVGRAELKRIYDLAAWLGWHVDHIHPLKGRNFCGLHVPWNLQVLTPVENSRKSNKLLEEYVS